MTYIDGHKKSGLKVGDTVRVTRKAKDYERGWGTVWVVCMDRMVGRTFNIVEDGKRDGFCLGDKFNLNPYLPYFVLEKVTPKKSKEKKNPHIGSSFDSYLKSIGDYEKVTLKVLARILRDLADEIERGGE